jgi:hypothetical protein
MANALNLARPKTPPSTPPLNAEGMYTQSEALFREGLGDVIAHGPTLYDTHSARVNTVVGTLPYYGPGRFLRYIFVETDTGAIYQCRIVASIPTWVWIGGISTVANLAALPTLGTNDAGYLAYDANLQHLYQWTGAAWQFAPGDPGAGFLVPSLTAAGPPNGGAWQLCDGTAAAVSKGNGTTENIVTPAMCAGAGLYFVCATNAPTGLVGTTAPTYVGGPTVTTGNDSGSATVLVGVGATVAQHTHTHSVTVPNINAPTVANGGLPNHAGFVWYMRL